MQNSKQKTLLRKRDFYEREDLLDAENVQVDWEKRQKQKNDEYTQNLKNKLFLLEDKSQKDFLQKAEIIDQENLDEFMCCICSNIAFSPVECQKCYKHLCSDCFKTLQSQKKTYECPTCRYALVPLPINEKIKRMRNNIKVICNNQNCFKEKKVICLDEYMSPFNHIGPCLQLEISCPLDCEQTLKTVEQGQEHFKQCMNRIEKCDKCEQLILKKMQGLHDCLPDLKEKLEQVEKWSSNEIQTLKKSQIDIDEKYKKAKEVIAGKHFNYDSDSLDSDIYSSGYSS